MAPGDTYQYNVSFTPANPVEGKEVTWESSDPDVVSIDENGYATALKIELLLLQQHLQDALQLVLSGLQKSLLDM